MLMTFIHCKDIKVCNELYWIAYFNDANPMSPPYGFMNNGVLELSNEDYFKLRSNEKICRLLDLYSNNGRILKIISEYEKED